MDEGQPASPQFSAEEYLRMMIESAQDYAIFASDIQDRITEWNSGAENIFGYSDAEIIGQPGAILYTPEDRRRKVPQKEITTALEQGHAVDDRWHLRKDGSRFFASGFVRPMYDPEGQLRGFIKIARDITMQKQLETFEREQYLLAETLRDTALALNSTLELNDVLDRILANVKRIIPHDASQVILLKGTQLDQIRSLGADDLTALETALRGVPAPLRRLPYLRQMYRTRKPFIIADLQTALKPGDPLLTSPFRACAGVPITDQDVMGFVMLYAIEANFFTDRHLPPLMAFAAQAGLAVKNAALYQTMQELTILRERQSLARDLHDSINQMIYASSLLAESLSKMVDQREDVQNGLENLRRLNRGALAEIRTLMQELRTGDISELELTMLLHQLAQSAMGHSQILIALDIDMQQPLPKNVQRTLYRIAQEALNNIIKHARATEATIRLVSYSDGVQLAIKDNGRGFDPVKMATRGMGLSIMQERVNSIGGTLQINSAMGQGTQLLVTWQPT